MRQRSASDQHISLNPPFGPRPRLALPQRLLAVEAALAEEWGEEPEGRREPERAQERATRALTVHSAQTSPPGLSQPATPADLQLIPRTSPALPAVSIKQSWFHRSSPRVTIIKLMLIGLVVFGVLGASFATAGGGKVTNFLFSALQSVAPFEPAQTSAPTTVAQRVKPIIQADINAGYDSREQHDIWWNSSCSAAAMTEILRAWGVQNVTIGQLIDLMSAHEPPYITSWGGLMSQDAWSYVMTSYHMRAVVHTNRSMSYNDIVRTIANQGIPVVIGVRDSGERYYPAFSVGHFLVAVGGDAAGLRIVDSSLYRIAYLPYDKLNYLWDGLTVVITQR